MAENNNNIPLAHVTLEFKPKNTPIDYFHLSSSLINVEDHEYVKPADVINLNLGVDEYLSVNHLNIDHNRRETIVLNLPVGKGKTSVCYDLIRKYHADGYYIIICSPFIKLVEKDYEELSQKFEAHEIFTYQDIEKSTKEHRSSLTRGVEARLLIMTTNMLLQNPGEKYYEQSYTKRDYLYYLEQIIRSKGKKIVFFFDEIHQSIENFKPEHLASLNTWINLAHKCFISSATFTPASVPVIRYISNLTEMRTRVFNATRLKNPVQAKLHLHISTESYSSNFIYPLMKLSTLVSQYEDRKIHILSGYESIVEALTRTKDPILSFKKVRDLNPNICTSKTTTKFNPDTHNIGTNFNTGVNIEDEKNVLIIIIPAITRSDANYGIFTDGLSTIIQSIGRLRKGGDIHIFMHAPKAIIDLESHKGFIVEKLLNGKENSSYLSPNDSYYKFVERYNKKYNRQQEGINILAAFDESEELKHQYPTLQQELVAKSQSLLVNTYESLGKGLSPYILWAAINNQFCNATLRTMELITKDYQHIPLTSGNIFEELSALLSENEKNILRGQFFKLACQKMTEYIQRSNRTITNEDSSTEQITILNKFTYNGAAKKNISELQKITVFNQAIVNIIYFLKKGERREISKDQYIHTCIDNAISNPNGEIPDLINAYTRLHRIRQQFLEFIHEKSIANKNDGKIIHQDAYTTLSDTFVAECIETIGLLKVNDLFYKSTFSFLQYIDESSVVTLANKKSIWLEFKKVFTNVGEDRRSHNGEKNKYYSVSEPVQKDLRITGIQFI